MVQRTIPELVAKYRLAPAVRDVFVEGPSDRRIIDFALRTWGCRDAAAVEVAAVEVPPALLRHYGLTGGAKQQVQALAWELERLLGPTAAQPTCVIDADCDRLLGVPHRGRLLLATDYPSMEAYLYHPDDIERLTHLVFGHQIGDVAAVMAGYSRVLQELFLIRAANQQMALGMGWIDFTKCCAGADPVELDREKLVTRLLDRAGLRGRRDELMGTVEALRRRTNPDARHQIHGHDLISLLGFANSRHAKSSGLPNDRAIASALVACMRTDRVFREPLFEEVRRRVAHGSAAR